MVAGAALTAALALGSLPGIAGSAGPTPAFVVDPSAFQSVQVPALTATAPAIDRSTRRIPRRPSRIDADTAFTEPGKAARGPRSVDPARSSARAHGGSAMKPPRYKLTGYATFYANGTTAMRLPRGTTIMVCGDGGCLERVINDYGPAANPDRPDRRSVHAGLLRDLRLPVVVAGTTWVTVSVY